jgi:hypothetical protein
MTDYDRLIDDVAKEMTAAAQPADLRARVLAEIGNEAKASYHWKLGWLAAAAGLLLAVYLGWPEREPVEQPAPPVVTQAPTQVGPSRETPPDVGFRPPTPARVRRPAAAATLEPTSASIPALGAPAAITIDPLDAGPTPVPALDVAPPLEIGTLDIKPLTSPPTATGGQ